MYEELKKLKEKLELTENKTDDEKKLLEELKRLKFISNDFSLSLSDNSCPTCGRKY